MEMILRRAAVPFTLIRSKVIESNDTPKWDLGLRLSQAHPLSADLRRNFSALMVATISHACNSGEFTADTQLQSMQSRSGLQFNDIFGTANAVLGWTWRPDYGGINYLYPDELRPGDFGPQF